MIPRCFSFAKIRFFVILSFGMLCSYCCACFWLPSPMQFNSLSRSLFGIFLCALVQVVT